MSEMVLTGYYLKRLARNRWFLIIGSALPVITALAALAIPGKAFSRACEWALPLACALFTGLWAILTYECDSASGLTDAFKTTPLAPSQISRSQLASGVLIFIAQVAIFTLIIAFLK